MKTHIRILNPPSVFAVISLVTGIVAGNAYSCYAYFFYIPALILIFSIFRKRLFFFLFLILVSFLGCFSIVNRLYSELPSSNIANFSGPSRYFIEGKAVSFSRHFKKKTRFVLLCRTIENEESGKKEVTGKIIVTVYGKSRVRYGDIVLFKSSVRPARNFSNPGGFDYKKFLRLKGIYGSAYASGKNIKILPEFDKRNFFIKILRAVENKRNDFFFFILREGRDASFVLASLVTGKREILPSEIRDLYSRAGASHILAISGLHLSIIAFLCFFILNRFFSLFSLLLISGRSRKLAGFLALGPLLLYSVFSGFYPSTQRAFIMTVIFMFALVAERETDLINSLAIAGIVILCINNASFFSISFQLSFMALIFIILGFSLLRNNELLYKKGIISKILNACLISFFAGLGTFPLVAHYFNTVSYVQVLSNLVVIPLVGFIALPSGLMSFACFSFYKPLALVFAKISCSAISLSVFYIRFLVSGPFSWSRIVTLNRYEISGIYLLMFSVYLYFGNMKKKAAALLCTAVIAGLLSFGLRSGEKPDNRELKITVIDVGQGNSALIETPEGKKILVDGGGFSDISSFDTGRYIVAPFLWHKGILSIDDIILTHPESDHMNGLIFILENFRVKRLIKNRDESDSRFYRRLMDMCKNRNISVMHPSKGRLKTGSISLFFHDSAAGFEKTNFNENSLVFLLKYNNFSMLFPGDIEEQRERSLSFGNMSDIRARVLLSPHHGSLTSSSRFFLDTVRPETVIISCGWLNRYGFPHASVLERYEEAGIRVFRTDINGAVSIFTDGKDYRVLSNRCG